MKCLKVGKKQKGRKERRHRKKQERGDQRGGELKGKNEIKDKKREEREEEGRKSEALLVWPQCKHPAWIYPLPVSFGQQQGAFNSPSL